MKILWVSDHPTLATGFANVTRYVCCDLADRGHDVFILHKKLPSGQPTPWQNCTLYPTGSSPDEQLKNLRQLQPDLVIMLGDIWYGPPYHPAVFDFIHSDKVFFAQYYPINGDMGEKRLLPSWVRLLKAIDLPIAMSRYGQDVTRANGIEPAYIPLGVDTKLFQPPADKDLAKRAFGYEDKFVILSDARNQRHKMLPRTLEIFRRFAADKDDVILHLHCDLNDPLVCPPNYHYDLRADIAFLNLTDKVCLTKNMSIFTGLPLEQLVQLYKAADVHLLASLGEGFGLPTLQAAATGVVPLASDYSASQELVTGHGEAVRVRHFVPDGFGVRCAFIDIDDAVSKLETLYRDRQRLAFKAQRAREFALAYDWEFILPQWDELLLREVPRRRINQRLSGILGTPRGEEGTSDLASEECTASKMAAEVFQEAQPEWVLSIPVTLPLAKSKQRLPGYVYAASQCDVPSVLALQHIFPGLKVWSTVQLDFGSLVSHDKSLQVKVVQANGAEYRSNLALSTLALDIGSLDPLLPIEAAKLRVPCIGLAQQREQALLWPSLSLEKPDSLMAAELGRQMLTDQGVAADLCLKARQHLAGALVGSEVQIH
jgi:glycosyltransferase involved in cell wall biosynthesis